MLENFVLWYLLIGKLVLVLGWLLAFLILFTIGRFIYSFILLDDSDWNMKDYSDDVVEKRKEKSKHIQSKVFKLWAPLCFLFIIFYVLFPKEKEFVLYVTASTVDEYNIEKKDSNLTPKAILEIVDKTLNRIENFMDDVDK